MLTQQEPHGKACLMDHYHAVKTRPAGIPPASLGHWPSAHSVPPCKAKRGQTCLQRQMIHHLDSPTLCLSKGVVLPGDSREMPAATKAPAGFSYVIRAAPSPPAQPARLRFPANTWAQAASRPCGKIYRRVENWVFEDFGSTSSSIEEETIGCVQCSPGKARGHSAQ